MNNSIINKEWEKLKLYLISLFFIIICSLLYFWFTLNHSFMSIEPESMMWYQFSNLQDKPYFDFIYLYIVMGSIVSLAQFLPEIIRNRIKIMIHLPCQLSHIIFRHLLIGSFFILLLSFIISLTLMIIVSSYYPDNIVFIIGKDVLFYTLLSVITYVLVSSVILENKNIFRFLKFLFLLSILLCLKKEEYLEEDFIWFLILLFVPFLVLDSFYSIKKQRLNSLIFKICFFIIIIFLSINSYDLYKKSYKREFNKYYIFYSNIVKDFVYQKNFGEHNFEYGIKNKETFSSLKYESFLPFVYWKNLDIQNKLPVTIENKIYTKNEIKNSRLSFNYNPRYLKKPELKLYPLFNPLSHRGIIKFPEEMFTYKNNGIVVYNYDDKISEKLTQDINQKLKNLNIQYPLLNVWGKTTNMKPHDKGYLIEDSNHNLFNLKRYDNQVEVQKINYPSNIDIKYIKISENKQKILSGYVIDKMNNVYLLTWNFDFIKLYTPHFDYKKMKLKIISNPKNYLIRYSGAKRYFAVAYDKEFNLIDEIVFEK